MIRHAMEPGFQRVCHPDRLRCAKNRQLTMELEMEIEGVSVLKETKPRTYN